MVDSNWGWLLIPKDFVSEDWFWMELAGVFFPDKNKTSFTHNGVTHILGVSDYFEPNDFSMDNRFEAPSYSVVLDVNSMEFLDFMPVEQIFF